MKKTTRRILLTAAAICVAMVWGCNNNPTPEEHTTGPHERLPQNVKVTCTVPQDTFNTWFKDGKPTENGTVVPANSVTFPHENNCSFYTWSEQMFLWITSPVSGGKYVLGNTVLESPVFYDVTTENKEGKRYMTRHEAGKRMKVSASITQNGPNNLPLVRDKEGNEFEVETHEQPANKAMLRNSAGGMDEVAKVETGVDGKHIFLNKAGKAIQHMPEIKHRNNRDHILVETKINGTSYFHDIKGNEHTEVGQATSDVLFAQNGSMVYYLLMVNDVYAWYLTACRNNMMSEYQFPTTAGARDSICAIARAHGETLPDSNALAMELKSAWVEVTNLPNPDSYITVEADVPVYETLSATMWRVKPNETRKAKLAMIGLHVVGSLAGHPEMSWATFEHVNNAPNAAYDYIDINGKVDTVPQDTGKGYLLCANANSGPFNVSHAKVPRNADSTNYIVGKNGNNIGPSATMLIYAFGTQMGSVPNQQDPSSAASNSEIIGINNAIRKMLVGNDVRKNYLLVGATWTFGGTAPNGNSYSATDTTHGVAIGASLLANSTMETYFQKPNRSCFTCHSAGNSLSPDSLSHIFEGLQPLPNVPKAMK